MMFNTTIQRNWSGKSGCKCFFPIDDVSNSVNSVNGDDKNETENDCLLRIGKLAYIIYDGR